LTTVPPLFLRTSFELDKMLVRPTIGIMRLPVVRELMFEDEIERTTDEPALGYRRAGPMDSSDVLAGYSAKEGLF
jgi:hypothetical protein